MKPVNYQSTVPNCVLNLQGCKYHPFFCFIKNFIKINFFNTYF